MSSYFIECCEDHVEGMKNRELAIEKTIAIYTAKLEIIRDERRNLEQGVINWKEEEANQ